MFYAEPKRKFGNVCVFCFCEENSTFLTFWTSLEIQGISKRVPIEMIRNFIRLKFETRFSKNQFDSNQQTNVDVTMIILLQIFSENCFHFLVEKIVFFYCQTNYMIPYGRAKSKFVIDDISCFGVWVNPDMCITRLARTQAHFFNETSGN